MPANRELTLTLPPEVPAGHVRLRLDWEPEAPPGGYRRRSLHPSLVPEKDAYIALLPELLRTRAGQYVVIADGKLLVAADTEREALHRAFRAARWCF